MSETLDLTKCCPDRPTYTLPGVCTNCGWRGRLVIPQGHRAPSGMSGARCERCGCKDVQAGRWGA